MWRSKLWSSKNNISHIILLDFNRWHMQIYIHWRKYFSAVNDWSSSFSIQLESNLKWLFCINCTKDKDFNRCVVHTLCCETAKLFNIAQYCQQHCEWTCRPADITGATILSPCHVVTLEARACESHDDCQLPQLCKNFEYDIDYANTHLKGDLTSRKEIFYQRRSFIDKCCFERS